ncbi:MAG: hypothetical protein ACSLFN_00935 [Candidatus Limnocylindrales bacterium]
MRQLTGLLALALALLVSGCGIGSPSAAPTPVTFEVPQFIGSTCDEIADQLGPVAGAMLLAVIRGPEAVQGESRSVLLPRVMNGLALSARDRMATLGITADCTMPAFLQRAERGFSDELRSTIGAVDYDGNPVIDYQAWLLEFSNMLVFVGVGEGG